MSAVTHRAVTEKASLPLATASYFFDSITALVQEAIRVHAGRDIEELHQLTASLSEQDSTPDEIAAAFAAAVAPTWPDTPAMFEVYLAAARNPGLRDVVAASLTAVRGVAAAAADAAQAPEPTEIAPALVALAHGFALHQIALPDQADPEDMRRAARTLLIGHLVEHRLVEEAIQLAQKPRGTRT